MRFLPKATIKLIPSFVVCFRVYPHSCHYRNYTANRIYLQCLCYDFRLSFFNYKQIIICTLPMHIYFLYMQYMYFIFAFFTGSFFFDLSPASIARMYTPCAKRKFCWKLKNKKIPSGISKGVVPF